MCKVCKSCTVQAVFGSLSCMSPHRASILDQIMRIWGLMLYWLLPLAAHGWWCETSAVTGCVGHPRHFVLEASSASSADALQKFEAGI